MTAPRVFVCAGGGGVGKTSTSAALALALARARQRTLLVTIDPARRLADAMGVALTHVVTPVVLPGVEGTLDALMPDPRRSADTFLDILFASEPAAAERVRQSRLFRALADAAAGVHEIVALSVLADACDRTPYDAVVIDTAPSRNALDFVRTPGRIADLLGGRAVAFLGTLASRAEAPRRGGLLSRLGGGVETLVGRVVGPNLLAETAALFTELARVRPRFVSLATRAGELLLGPQTTWLLVGAPTAAARDDLHFLADALRRLGKQPRAVLLNRAEAEDASWLEALEALPPVLEPLIRALRDEHTVRLDATRAAMADLAVRLPGTCVLPLPTVLATAPADIVAALATAIDRLRGELGAST